MASPLIHENIWFERPKYEAAERQYYERLAKGIQESHPSADLQEYPKEEMKACKDEKRSKRDKKNKNKDKKKDPQKDLSVSKLSNGTPVVESKPSGDVSIDGCIKSLKNKTNGIVSEEKKGNAHFGPQGSIHCRVLEDGAEKKPLGYSPVTVKGSFVECYGGNSAGLCNKASNMHFGDHLLEEKGSDLWNTDQRKVFEKASSNSPKKQSLASEVAKARQHIKQSLECMDGIATMAGNNVDLVNRINSLEKENTNLHKVVDDLKNLVITLDKRVKSLEGGKPSSVPAPAKPVKKEEEEDDGVDLFGSDSDEESAEAAKVREARLAAYAEKKSKKPTLIAKSNIILSVSPWDDETDMKKMEECVRTIEMDGLVWGASKLVPLAYGIHKLHISCVVEDDKVSVDLLQEKIQEFEDYVQSADIAAFNKV